jgi:hypothetical protein
MFVSKVSVDGPDTGKWFMMVVEGKTAIRRVGYCAGNCDGHSTEAEATEHFLQYQLDREVDLWLARRSERACEICGEPTTLRARLGRKTELFVLCQKHQSTISLQKLARSSIVARSVEKP